MLDMLQLVKHPGEFSSFHCIVIILQYNDFNYILKINSIFHLILIFLMLNNHFNNQTFVESHLQHFSKPVVNIQISPMIYSMLTFLLNLHEIKRIVFGLQEIVVSV